ncbi:MAG: hypothetical protein QF704_13800, partial [Anaerolineales bacterium]|nr:hypothetical protein [Anaerolineales bacterium]
PAWLTALKKCSLTIPINARYAMRTVLIAWDPTQPTASPATEDFFYQVISVVSRWSVRTDYFLIGLPMIVRSVIRFVLRVMGRLRRIV